MMKRKTAGFSDSNEQKDRLHLLIKSRVDQQLALDDALSMSRPTRDSEKALARKLFAQAEVATTNAPSLQPNFVEEAEKVDDGRKSNMVGGPAKVASVRDIIEQRLEGSVAPRVDLFMEKNAHIFYTEAQRNFPELLKVACGDAAKARPARRVSPNPTQGAVPTRSNSAGGSA